MSDTTTLEKRAIEKQNRAWAVMKEIQERATKDGRDFTAEERTKWDAAEKDVDEAGGDIERLQRAAKLDGIDREQIAEREDRGGPKSELEKRYEEAFSAYMARGTVTGEQRALLESPPKELRALGTAADNIGGYLVPEGFRKKMVETMKAFGGVADLTDEINTTTGNPLPWVSNDDTGNEGEIIGENTPVTEQDLTFGGRKLGAHIYSSKMVRVPITLLQDGAFDIDSWLPGKLGERIGRRSARSWITGTGVDEPEGLTTNVTVGKTGASGQTTSIIYNDLIDMEHSIDPAYRNERAGYVLGDTLLKTIRKLVDGQSRPLWVPVPTVGMAPTLNGRSYKIDNSMPVPAANAISLLYGDFKAAYVRRTVLGVQNVRLTERYAEYLQVGFFGYMRQDGMVQDPSAYRAYKHAAS